MKTECLMQMHICAPLGTYSQHEMLMKIVMHLSKTCMICE